jgi:hypothetical protein
MDMKQKRMRQINKLISVIASCGRKFYSYNGTVAEFKIWGNGRLYFVEPYGRNLLPCYSKPDSHRWNTHRWGRFGGGGTLKAMTKSFAAYILTGATVPAHHFGPWPEWYCGNPNDLWGYGDEAMEKVRSAAVLVSTARQG